MADQLQILIETGFKINREQLDKTLSQLKNTKLQLNVDQSAFANIGKEISRQNELYGKLSQLLKEQYATETKILEAKNSKNADLEKELRTQLEINKARSQVISNSIKNDNLINYEKEARLLTEEHNLKQKLVAKENELAEARKKSTQFSSEKNLQEYWKTAEKYINDYKNGLKSAIETQAKLGQMMGVGQSKNYYKYDQLTQQQQNAMRGTYNNAVNEIQKKSYQELNKLLTEQYNLLMRIEEAKLKRYQSIGSSDAEKQEVTVLEKQLQKQLELNQARRDAINATLNNNGLVNQEKLNQLLEREKQLKSELVIKENQIASAQKVTNEKAEYQLKTFQQSMNIQADSLNRRYSYVSGASAEIDKYRQALQNVTAENGKWYISQQQADGTMKKTAVTAQQLRMQFRQMRSDIQGSIGIFDALRQNMTKFAQYFFAGGFIVQAIRQVREMFSYINQMNTYMTNVRIITGSTADEVSNLTSEYQKLGKQLGMTSQSIAQVAEDFYRQGLDESQITKMTEMTAQMATLAGMGMSEATEYITSIKNGYKMSIDEVSRAIDSLVSIDNNAATSVNELATALARSSNTAQSVGVDFNTLAGYIGAISATTRKSAETIGESMKSIFTRFSDIKLSTMFGGGWLEDGDSASNVEKTMRKIGVSFRNAEGEFRSFEDVINDLSAKWKSLDEESQRAVAKSMAGTYQRENFMVLLNNLSEATELTEKATDSAGLAQERYGIYLESTEAKISKLKTSLQELYSSVLNSDFINSFLDSTTAILNMISALGGVEPLIKGILGVWLMVKRESIGKSIETSFLTVKTNLVSLKETLSLVKMQFLDARAKGMGFGASLKEITVQMGLFKSVSSAMVGSIGLITTALSIGSMIYSSIKQKQEEAVATQKELIQKNRELADSYVSQISELEELRDSYKEIYNSSVSKEEKDVQLKEIQDKLIETYGIEKDKIDLLNGSYEKQLEIIQNLINDKPKLANQFIEDDNKAIQKEFFDYSSIFKNDNGKTITYYLTDEQLKQLDEISAQVREAYGGELSKWQLNVSDYFTGKGSIFENGTGFNFGLMIQKGTFEENMKATIDAYKAYIEKMDNTSLDNTDFYNMMKARLSTAEELYKKYTDNLTQIDKNVMTEIVSKAKSELNIQDLNSMNEEQRKSFMELVQEYANGKENIIDMIREMISVQNEIPQQTVSAIDNLKSALESIDTTNLSSENADLLSKSLKTLDEGGKLTYEDFSKLTALFPYLAKLFGDCNDVTLDFSDSLDYIHGIIDDYGSSMELLDSAIEKVKNGQQLSGDEINNLTRQYPQLQAQLDETTGLYYIELEALEKTRGQIDTTAQAQIKAEISKTKTVIEQAKARVSAYVAEQSALKGLATYNEKTNQIDFNNMPDNIKDNILSTNQQVKDDYFKALGDTQEIEEYNKIIEQLEKSLTELDVIAKNGNEKDTKKSSLSYIEEGFDDQIDIIKAKREALANEISTLQSDIEIAMTKHGDGSQYVQNLKTQLESLREEEKTLISSQAEELRNYRDELFSKLTANTNMFDGLTVDEIDSVALEKAKREFEKTIQDMGDTDTTSVKMLQGYVEELANAIISANDELKTLGDDFYKNKKESLDEYISRVQEALSYDEALYSDKESEANLRINVLDESDEGYLNTMISIQKELIDEKIKLQESYKRAYKEGLKELGSAESSYMRELKSKWETTETEILEMKKEMNEKYISYIQGRVSSVTTYRDEVVKMLRKQDDLQKDIYEKQKDAIKEKADAEKKGLENRKKELDTIKSEYDYQNKIADLQRALKDTLSDINALEYDDTADAIQAKVELANKLQDDQKALSDEEFNHAIDLAKEAIDDAISAIEAQTQAQTDAIDKLIDALSDKTDREYASQAESMMLNSMEETNKKLLEYNREWGDGIDATITKLFDSASQTMQEVKSNGQTVPEFLNLFSNMAYAKELENKNLTSQKIDGVAINGAGIEEISKNIFSTENVMNFVNPLINGMSSVLQTLTGNIKQPVNNVTTPMTIQFNVTGDAQQGAVDKCISWFKTSAMPMIESHIEKNLSPIVDNVTGRTK